MKAIIIKNWCEENISPLAWQRIVLKIIDAAYAEGYSLQEIEEPNDSLVLSNKMQTLVNQVMMQLYSRQYAM